VFKLKLKKIITPILICLLFMHNSYSEINKYQEHRLFGQDWPIFVNPDLGFAPLYNGSSLLTNYNQQMMDFTLLDFRQEFEDTRLGYHKIIPHSYAILSGSFGLDYLHQRPYTDFLVDAIELYVAEISMLTTLGPLLTGLLTLDYDNSVPNTNSYPAIGIPIGGNNFYFDQAFFTIGNNNLGPWHATLGQVYVPYGEYNSFMVNSPLSSTLFINQAPSAMLGYSDDLTNRDILNAQIFLYHDFATVKPNNYGSLQNGLLLNLEHQFEHGYLLLGASYISDLTNSNSIQYNSQSAKNPNANYCELFAGFAVDCGNGELLEHYVPGVDFFADLSLWDFTFYVEYLTATKQYAESNLTFNGHGARPSGFDIEGSYAFTFLGKPASLSAGYSFTKQSVAMLLPTYEFAAAGTISFFRDTFTKLGFQYDVDYPVGTTGTGQGLPIYNQSDVIDLGKYSYSVILMTTVSF
jgi:hypothetical protein